MEMGKGNRQSCSFSEFAGEGVEVQLNSKQIGKSLAFPPFSEVLHKMSDLTGLPGGKSGQGQGFAFAFTPLSAGSCPRTVGQAHSEPRRIADTTRKRASTGLPVP